MSKTEITKNEIIEIARRNGTFSTRLCGHGWRKRLVSKCNELVREGVFSRGESHHGEISFKFISFPGCPKAVSALNKSRSQKNVYTTRNGVISLLNSKGKLKAMKKPLRATYVSFAQHCKNLCDDGIIRLSHTDDNYIHYVSNTQ